MALLLVASTGGHLSELFELAPRFDVAADDALWVTFDSPQSRSLLQGRRVHFVPHIASRDVAGVVRGLREAWSVVSSAPWDAVVSTGAAVAMGYLPLARARGLPVHYIESAARTDGPSLTGRMLQRLPGAHLYTQYTDWADSRWLHRGSVFDNFSPETRPPLERVRSMLVVLGTSPFPFRRLVSRIEATVPNDVDIHWQLAEGVPAPSRGTCHSMMPASELAELHRHVDVVVAHAGVGSALMALAEGLTPVLVPREARHGEHVDDHQQAIVSDLSRRGLAVAASADRLDMADVVRATGIRVRRSVAPSFSLTTG